MYSFFYFKDGRDKAIFECLWDIYKEEDDEDTGGAENKESVGLLTRIKDLRFIAQAQEKAFHIYGEELLPQLKGAERGEALRQQGL